MARTTLDLDDHILQQLKERRDREHRPMGAIASELLAQALARGDSEGRPDFVWTSRSMGFRVDLEDKEALWAALDE